MPALDASNPYVGPPPFQERDAARFFGRDSEARLLLNLVRSEQVVLLFSQSGAGKTSLVNARLIPGLRQEGCEVLPVVRVDAEPPAGVVPANVYAFSTLWCLAGGSADLADLANRRIETYLQSLPDTGSGERRLRILIFDQFEEIFTVRRGRPEEERRDFFQQLRQSLRDDPSLAVVLVLREDHLAGLEPYAVQIPGQLQTRFRLEQLRPAAAVAAIARPAELAGRPFAPGVAERLVDDLRREHAAGREEPVLGEHVLPVQLQVVCFRLWDQLRDRPGEQITEQDLQAAGDVEEALEQFYADAVDRAAAGSGLPAARIRSWCETRLITAPPVRIRSQVLQQAEASGGLAHRAVDLLIEAHLVRREETRGGTWCELAHDLFIDPVLRSNERAQVPEVRQLARRAAEWRAAHRDASYLDRGSQLAEALSWARAFPEALGEEEQEFLAQSQRAAGDEARHTRLRRLWVGALVALLAVAGWLAVRATSAEQSSSALAKAFEALNSLETDPGQSLLLIREALDKSEQPPVAVEGALHRILLEQSDRVQESRSFEISSEAVGAFAFAPSGRRFVAVEQDGELGLMDRSTGRRVRVLAGHGAPVTTAVFSPDGALLATGDADGRVLVRSAGTFATVPDGALLATGAAGGRVLVHSAGTFAGQSAGSFAALETGAAVNELAFHPGGALLAVAGDAGVAVWDLRTGRKWPGFSGGTAEAFLGVAFNAAGTLLATAGEDGTAAVWEVATGRRQGEPLVHPDAVTRVAFGPGGELVTACRDGLVRIRGASSGATRVLAGAGEPVADLAFSPDGELLATAGFDGTARIWRTASGQGFQTLAPSGCGRVLRVAFRGAVLATTCELRRPEDRGAVTFWIRNEGTGRRIARPMARLLALTFTGKGQLVALERSGAWILDLAGHPLRASAAVLPIPTAPLALAGDQMVTAEEPGVVRLRAVPSGREVRRWQVGKDPLSAVAFSADGRLLATADVHGTVAVWRGARAAVLPALNRKAVLALAFSPDNRLLARAGLDGTIHLWDLRSEAEAGEPLTGYGAGVTHLAFSPDGRHLASADAAGKVIVWDFASRRQLFPLPGLDVAFSPDGRWLATAQVDGVIHLEPMKIADLRAEVERLLPVEPQR